MRSGLRLLARGSRWRRVNHGWVPAVADRLAQAMAGVNLRPPSIPYTSNRGGRALYDAHDIGHDLATSVAHPVRWYDALEVLRELGAKVFIEMAPGHVSTHLVSDLFPDVRAVSIADQGLRHATVVAARENAPTANL